MRSSNSEVRRQVAAVVATAERAVALRPDAAWPRASLAFCRQLDALAETDAPDPAAVVALAMAYDAAWRAHVAAPSFHFLQALPAVRAMHRCRWCDYDRRASPARCPECGRTPDEPAAGPALASSRRRRQALWSGVACLCAAGALGPPLPPRDWPVHLPSGHALCSVALLLVGVVLAAIATRPSSSR